MIKAEISLESRHDQSKKTYLMTTSTVARVNVPAVPTAMTGDSDSTHDLTELLQAWSSGEQQALEKLAPRVQEELHRIASRYMAGERPNHPLQTTALINEAYIRLINWKNVRWQSRAHFFAVAAQIMRRILVDFARARTQVKHGKGIVEQSLDEAYVLQAERSSELVILDEALTRLAEMDPRKGRLVELRFFGGLSVEETALVMELSDRTVEREWTLAKAWLYRELRRPES
jgi:RNA polymerase sigma factor (TIGR02999 family)